LDNLNLNYIDILILYYRAFIDYIEVWKLLEKCVLSDKINKLGLYNFNINEIKDIIEKYNIKPFYYKINFELSLFFHLSEFMNFCFNLLFRTK
jgi:diketogulonate reductase-like aldo/keto reductase